MNMLKKKYGFKEDKMKFKDLQFNEKLQEGLDIMGFHETTPIQEKTIPLILKNKDLIACAQTGTGKTAAFVLPILNKLCYYQNKKIAWETKQNSAEDAA